MVHFITGPVGSGKSTKLLEVFNKSKRAGDGFYNLRLFEGGETIGQDLVRLSTGERVPLTRTDRSIPTNWDEGERYMNYSFSKKGLLFANYIIDTVITDNKKEAFVDELGPLEQRKKGLYNRFNQLLHAKVDIYVVCRDICLDAITDMFSISSCTITVLPRCT